MQRRAEKNDYTLQENTLLSFGTSLIETITDIIITVTYGIDENYTGKLKNSKKKKEAWNHI